MLAFDPSERITVEGALEHPYFKDYYEVANEPKIEPLNFDFDQKCITLADIKTCILQEINVYRSVEPEIPLNIQLSGLKINRGAALVEVKEDHLGDDHKKAVREPAPLRSDLLFPNVLGGSECHRSA